jgi:transcriptional regulator with XRE-family HTH domain
MRVNWIHPKSESYGDAIKAFREYANLNQEELAEILGVTQITISFWENYHKRPHISNFRKINEFLRKWHSENPDITDDVINIV